MSDEKKRKKMILIGRSTAGKTTMAQRITARKIAYEKTQALGVFDDFIFDTPGEYLEVRGYRNALTVTSAEADVIVFVKSSKEPTSLFPPAYSSLFLGKPVVGVVTKIDIASPKEIDESVESLKLAGAGRIFKVSSYTGEGIDEFIDFLEEQGKREVR